MSRKSKMHSISEKKATNSITLKGGYVSLKIDKIHQHLQEIKRGCGVQENANTYNRKKNTRMDNDYDCSFSI